MAFFFFFFFFFSKPFHLVCKSQRLKNMFSIYKKKNFWRLLNIFYRSRKDRIYFRFLFIVNIFQSRYIMASLLFVKVLLYHNKITIFL